SNGSCNALPLSEGAADILLDRGEWPVHSAWVESCKGKLSAADAAHAERPTSLDERRRCVDQPRFTGPWHDLTLRGAGGTPSMLELQNVTHVYANGTRALDDVTLAIPKGMFGLLGPNGAGKSTLMRSIATLQTPTSGSIVFDGIDVIKEPGTLRRTLGSDRKSGV